MKYHSGVKQISYMFTVTGVALELRVNTLTNLPDTCCIAGGSVGGMVSVCKGFVIASPAHYAGRGNPVANVAMFTKKMRLMLLCCVHFAGLLRRKMHSSQ